MTHPDLLTLGVNINQSTLFSSSSNGPHKTWDIHPVLGRCWTCVVDAGPTLDQHRVNLSRLLHGLVPQMHNIQPWFNRRWPNIKPTLGHLESVISFPNLLTLILLKGLIKYLYFHPTEVVSRYRDTQLQVGENYSYLFNFWRNICKSWCLNAQFIPDMSD